jgi:hypothetical protein
MVISPSSRPTILLTIERPRPVPLEREFSWANGVNNLLLKNSLEIPFPVSLTVMVTMDLGMLSALPGV